MQKNESNNVKIGYSINNDYVLPLPPRESH